MNRRIALTLSISFVWISLMACCFPGPNRGGGGGNPAGTQSPPPKHVDKFIDRFGKADKDDKDGDNRILLYNNAKGEPNLKIIFGKDGNAVEYIGPANGEKLVENDVLTRLYFRDPQTKEARDIRDADKAREEARKKNAPPEQKVTRDNYNRINEGMSLDEVQAILGPGKEGARAGAILTATWSSGGFGGTVISITFQNNLVKAKAIHGR